MVFSPASLLDDVLYSCCPGQSLHFTPLCYFPTSLQLFPKNVTQSTTQIHLRKVKRKNSLSSLFCHAKLVFKITFPQIPRNYLRYLPLVTSDPEHNTRLSIKNIIAGVADLFFFPPSPLIIYKLHMKIKDY